MPNYPILYRITHVVSCAYFDAWVVAEGRVLMTFEDDEWWSHGVDPGGLTESGDGPLPAFERFRASFRHALDDLATGCESIEEFRRDAQVFFATDVIDE